MVPVTTADQEAERTADQDPNRHSYQQSMPISGSEPKDTILDSFVSVS